MKNFFKAITVLVITVLFSTGLFAKNSIAVSNYKGIPKTDANFARFLQNNVNKVVMLDLTIVNPNEYDDITIGYRGVSPTFYIASQGKQEYEAYIDCNQINNQNAQTTIGQCAPYVKWNTKTGRLTGKFKIVKQGKNAMGSLLFYLIAVK